MMNECKNIVFFGGAGISTESGVKDYRSEDGLYNTVKEYGVSPETILSHTFFFEHTDIFYDFYRKYFVTEAKPNKAHYALAKLEKMGKLRAIVTQNIDNLHQSANSVNVIELHGNAGEFFCSSCKTAGNNEESLKEIKNKKIPRCSVCSGVMKPKVVLYEETLYEGVAESAIKYISAADMLIVGGTSLAVYPAASFIRYFRGRYLVIINKTATDYDNNADLVIRSSIGEVLDTAVNKIYNF